MRIEKRRAAKGRSVGWNGRYSNVTSADSRKSVVAATNTAYSVIQIMACGLQRTGSTTAWIAAKPAITRRRTQFKLNKLWIKSALRAGESAWDLITVPMAHLILNRGER